MGACPGSTCEGVDAMGRGRQKAKQTKVARQLKYFSPDTDYNALQRELTGGSSPNGHGEEDPPAAEVDPYTGDAEDDDVGEYAEWSAKPER